MITLNNHHQHQLTFEYVFTSTLYILTKLLLPPSYLSTLINLMIEPFNLVVHSQTANRERVPSNQSPLAHQLSSAYT